MPLDRIDDAWNVLLEEAPTGTAAITDYFVNTWFEGNFAMAIWNQAKPSTPRTNNGAEGYHSKISKWVSSAHPTIYKLIKTLKVIDYAEAVQFFATKNGAESKKMTKAALKKEATFANLLASLQSNDVTIKEYLVGASLLVAFRYN